MPRNRAASKKSGKKAKRSAKAPRERRKALRSLGQAVLTKTRNSSHTSDHNATTIATFAELLQALTDRAPEIVLTENIIAEENITISHDVEINLNGYSIIANESRATARALDVRSGRVTLRGPGKIFAMGKSSVAIRAFGAISSGVPDYTKVTIGEGVSLFAPDGYGVLISPNLGVAYGLTLDIAGQIFAQSGICLASGVRGYDQNAPVIQIQNGAQIIADDATGAAIEAAGYARWQIAAAELRGAAGVAMGSGGLEFSGTKILASRDECFHILENSEALLEVKLIGGGYAALAGSIIGGTPQPLKRFTAENCNFYTPVSAIPKEFSSIVKRKKVEVHADVTGYLEQLSVASAPDDTEEKLAAAFAETSDFEMDDEAEILDELQHETIADDIAPEAEDLSIDALENEIAAELDLDDDFETEMTEELALADEEDEIEAALQREIDRLDAEEFAEMEDLTVKELAAKPTEPKPAQPAQLFAPAPEPAVPFSSEQEAARRALTDAISDIRKLSAEDYDTGFSELEQAIQGAEKILANPLASLAEICEAASVLLSAFDDLEERDETAAMSDTELDELFYHGAVLQEMLKEVRQEKPKPHRKHSWHRKPTRVLPESVAAAGVPELAAVLEQRRTAAPVSFATSGPTTNNTPNPYLVPDFSTLSGVLTRIAELDLNSYTQASQAMLLQTLASAEGLLNDPSATQSAIDHLAEKLNTEIAELVPLRQAPTTAARYYAELSAPAPLVGTVMASVMIDEMAPNATWSLGVTMIDELAPFVVDATTREKMMRAMQSRLYIIKKSLSQPFLRLKKSLAAGLRAGVKAYKETLHAFTR